MSSMRKVLIGSSTLNLPAQRPKAVAVVTTNSHSAEAQQPQTLAQKKVIQTQNIEKHSTRTSTSTEVQVIRKEIVAKLEAPAPSPIQNEQATMLNETLRTSRERFKADLPKVASYINPIPVQSFSKFINQARRVSVPLPGSRWDKVLEWAKFFAIQISAYDKEIYTSTPGNNGGSKLMLAACRYLIELSPGNWQAIEAAFEVFNRQALSLKFLFDNYKFLDPNVRLDIDHVFHELLVLVQDVTLRYHFQISTISDQVVSLDFNKVFSVNLEALYKSREKIIQSIWEQKLKGSPGKINQLRSWLGEKDSVTRSILDSRAAAKSHPSEFTCEWIYRDILDFSRGNNDILVVTGPSGSGKTVLSGWISERLWRPLGTKTHETLPIFFDSDLPSHCTTLSTAKALALQLLQVNIGDLRLLGSLEKAYSTSLTSTDSASAEDQIWDAIHIGLRNSETSNFMFLIDGLDNRCGTQNVTAISGKICQIVSQHKNAQAIVLARKYTHLDKLGAHVIEVDIESAHQDIIHVAENALCKFQHFQALDHNEKQEILKRWDQAAKGNFLWVRLMLESVTLEHSQDAFLKAVRMKEEPPKTLNQLIHDLVFQATEDFRKRELALVLQWLLVSKRPLALEEIRSLFLALKQKETNVSESSNISEFLDIGGGHLITIRRGAVQIRHDAVREYLRIMAERRVKFPSIQAIQADFTLRILAYCKPKLTETTQISFECPPIDNTTELLRTDDLLQYAITNWLMHFKMSSFYKSSGDFELNSEFTSSFPNSVQFPLMEWCCWQAHMGLFEATKWHNLSMRIRLQAFGEKDESVLQNLIICGHASRMALGIEIAREHFYRTLHTGLDVLPLEVTISCSKIFLELSGTEKITTRTELVTHREEILLSLILIYKQQHTIGMIIYYSRILVVLYTECQEMSKAEQVQADLREIAITRFRNGSVEEKRELENLDITFNKRKEEEEMSAYDENIFAYFPEIEEAWGFHRIAEILKLAVACEEKGDLFKAEEHFVTLWIDLIAHFQTFSTQTSTEVYIWALKISLLYVSFLIRQKRSEEAGNILLCVWAEYENHESDSEEIFLLLKSIGEQMYFVRLLLPSISAFKKCSSWFARHSKDTHRAACQTLFLATATEHFELLNRTLGLSHVETLSSLRELVRAHQEQKTTQSTLINNLLLTSSIAILSTEKSTWKLFHAAKTIAEAYLPNNLTDGQTLLRELHRQIASKDYSPSEPRFKLSIEIGKESYVFLVAFEATLLSSKGISHSKVMSDYLADILLHRSNILSSKSESDEWAILSTCARRYISLLKSSRKREVQLLKEDMHKIFLSRWRSVVQCPPDVSMLLLVGLLEVLGQHPETDISITACKAVNKVVFELLNKKEVDNAYNIGLCGLNFIRHNGGFNNRQSMGYGFELSSLLLLREHPTLQKSVQADLYVKTLSLSKDVIDEVLYEGSNVNFVRLKPSELNDLIGLLGEQQNYPQLERLLNILWYSRENQTSWIPEITTSIGSLLAQAYFLNSNQRQAIDLSENIIFNLHRANALDPIALEMYNLLSSMYQKVKRYKDAMKVHEEVLNLVVERKEKEEEEDEDELCEVSAGDARRQIEGLRQAWLREGKWDRDVGVYKALVDKVMDMEEYRGTEEFRDLKGVESWSLQEGRDPAAEFARCEKWEIVFDKRAKEEMVVISQAASSGILRSKTVKW